MTLRDLEPQFIRVGPPGEYGANVLENVETLADAQGLIHLCPSCFTANGGSLAGVHSILVWFSGRNVPADARPTPRWAVSGTGYADLTVTPSIDASTAVCGAHFFISSGAIQMA